MPISTNLTDLSQVSSAQFQYISVLFI